MSRGLRLSLVRHAKSSWSFAGLDDFHRPLNKRGLRDALRMPGLVAARLPAPDLLLSSDAVRAVQTCQVMADGCAVAEARVVLDHVLYLADSDTLLETLTCLGGEPNHVMLVGHNPGLTDLYNLLADSPIDNLPTFSVAHLELATARWPELAPRAARSTRLLLPKELMRDV